jgi:hypothetical protein
MGYHLFLDDDRTPDGVTWVKIPQHRPPEHTVPWMLARSYHTFIQHVLDYGVPAYVSFDHDLGDNAYAAAVRGDEDYQGEKTGFDCAMWLVNYCHDNDLQFPQFQVHSMNPIGAKKIRDYIMNASLVGFIRTPWREPTPQ